MLYAVYAFTERTAVILIIAQMVDEHITTTENQKPKKKSRTITTRTQTSKRHALSDKGKIIIRKYGLKYASTFANCELN